MPRCHWGSFKGFVCCHLQDPAFALVSLPLENEDLRIAGGRLRWAEALDALYLFSQPLSSTAYGPCHGTLADASDSQLLRSRPDLGSLRRGGRTWTESFPLFLGVTSSRCAAAPSAGCLGSRLRWRWGPESPELCLRRGGRARAEVVR